MRQPRLQLALVHLLLGLSYGCKQRPPETKLLAGGLYTVESEPGKFGDAKLLVYEDGICHVRLYREEYPSRPATLDPTKLTLGGADDKEGFSLGHVPLREESFRAWKPVLAGKAEVKAEELEAIESGRRRAGGARFDRATRDGPNTEGALSRIRSQPVRLGREFRYRTGSISANHRPGAG